MKHREIIVRAARIDSYSRKPRTFDPGRTCAVCSTILSIFNRGSRCSIHESPHFAKYRARHKQVNP